VWLRKVEVRGFAGGEANQRPGLGDGRFFYGRLKYGTVPVVRATGGLDDTIEPWDARTDKGTSFKFTDYTGEALLATVKQALLAYRDQSSWQTLMRNGMGRDFSWGASAREYGKIYDRIRQTRAATA
jgi:starch synthase